MASRTSSSSSSSSETEETTTQLGATSEISRHTEQSVSHRHGASASDVVDRESSTIRSRSPSASFGSVIATGTPYDTLSMATSNSAGFTSTSTSRQVLSHEQLGGQTNGGTVNQHYQQRQAQPQMSAYSSSTISSSGGSLSSPGSVSFAQQPRFDAAKAIFNQVDANHDGSITREEFRQWAQPGSSGNEQYQTQYLDQTPAHQAYGEYLGSDVMLNIDYGAMEAYNIAMQSADDFDVGPQPSNGQPAGPHFDAAKAIFNQVDVNRDGGISRDEFRQWAQGRQQQFAGAPPTNYADHFNQAQLFPGSSSDIASILQQSGLGQTLTNY